MGIGTFSSRFYAHKWSNFAMSKTLIDFFHQLKHFRIFISIVNMNMWSSQRQHKTKYIFQSFMLCWYPTEICGLKIVCCLLPHTFINPFSRISPLSKLKANPSTSTLSHHPFRMAGADDQNIGNWKMTRSALASLSISVFLSSESLPCRNAFPLSTL